MAQKTVNYQLEKKATEEQIKSARERELNRFPKYPNGTKFVVESVDYCAYIIDGKPANTATLSLIGKIGDKDEALAVSLFMKDYINTEGEIINLSTPLAKAVQEDFATSATGADFEEKCKKRFPKGYEMTAVLKGFMGEYGVRKYNDWNGKVD